MSKLRGKGPLPPFSIVPQAFPEGLFMTMPVLDRPSLEESYPTLGNRSCTGAKQSEVKWSEGVLLPRR